MRHTSLLVWCASLLVLACPGADAFAQRAGGTVVQRGTVEDDLYLAAGQVDVLATVEGDLIVAGGRVNVGDVVKGDVLAAGGAVTVHGRVLDDVRVAGGQVSIQADVAGDVTAVGGSVSVPREARVHGRAWLAGGEVDVQGRVGRSLRAAASRIRLGGDIEGDVHLAAGDIEVLPTARVRGALVYESPHEARVAAGAQIDGGVRRSPAEWPEAGRRASRLFMWVALVFGVGGLLVAGATMAALLPRWTAASAGTIRTDPWKSLGVGFAVLVAAPAAAFALVATVVGAMVGLALLAAYGVSLLAALLVGATWVGALGTRLFHRDPGVGRVVISTLAGILVLGLLQVVPLLGALVLALVTLLGMGGWTVHGYRAYTAGRP